MKTQLTQAQATAELLKLKALNDGKDYCMTYDAWAKGSKKWSAGEKTDRQKKIDVSSPELANAKFVDFVKNYDLSEDLH